MRSDQLFFFFFLFFFFYVTTFLFFHFLLFTFLDDFQSYLTPDDTTPYERQRIIRPPTQPLQMTLNIEQDKRGPKSQAAPVCPFSPIPQFVHSSLLPHFIPAMFMVYGWVWFSVMYKNDFLVFAPFSSIYCIFFSSFFFLTSRYCELRYIFWIMNWS